MCYLPDAGEERMMKKVVLFALVLSGCGQSDANIYGCCMGQNVVGNEVSVQVTNVWNQTDAFPLADQHCHKFGRAARFASMRGNIANYDCVKAS